jgi:hypothetical protein
VVRGFAGEIAMTSVRDEAKCAMEWLVGKWHWPAACLFAAAIMLLMLPVWASAAGAVLALVYLQLPLYMIHQFEEHTGDRFRTYLNRNVAHCDALTPAATFWINSIGVWGVDLAALYLACFVNPAYALVAFYMPIVNALTHIREAVARREYNPGLCTSIALFLPFAGWGLYEVSVRSGATWGDHGVGLLAAVGIHMAIVIYLVTRVMRLRTAVAA